MTNPLVSIIINCFNGEKYLKETIQSIYNQTYENWEIIFWDNLSTDNSKKIAKSFGPKVKYYKAINHTSLGEARKKAVERTSGELIAFVDCDDLWTANKLELQVDKILSSDFSLCYSGCIDIDEHGRFIRTSIPSYQDGYMLENLLFQFDLYMASIIVRKDSLKKHNLNFDKNIFASEEYCLFMQLAAKEKFCSVKEPLVKMRIRKDSLTSEQVSRAAFERRYTLDMIKSQNKNIEKKFMNAFLEAYARADFYEAKYNLKIGKKIKARKIMSKIKGINYKYFLIYLILFFPISIWNIINGERLKRAITNILK
tara:strand:- start:8773 stop:9708 length:936 start_codon:yes stop_codon:yes gene_type:complete